MFKSWRMSIRQINLKALKVTFLGQAGTVLSMILYKNKITFIKFLLIFLPLFGLRNGRVNLPSRRLAGLGHTAKEESPANWAPPLGQVQAQGGTHRHRVPRWSLSAQAAAVDQATPAALVFSCLWPCDVRWSASSGLC
jgi:hypothetical protein